LAFQSSQVTRAPLLGSSVFQRCRFVDFPRHLFRFFPPPPPPTFSDHKAILFPLRSFSVPPRTKHLFVQMRCGECLLLECSYLFYVAMWTDESTADRMSSVRFFLCVRRLNDYLGITFLIQATPPPPPFRWDLMILGAAFPPLLINPRVGDWLPWPVASSVEAVLPNPIFDTICVLPFPCLRSLPGS